MADWRRPDASRLFNDAGEGEAMSPYPMLYHDVLDQFELRTRTATNGWYQLSPLTMSIMSLASWAGSRGVWPVHSSPARWPLGQLVGPPCSRIVPAFNALVANFTIFMARVLEWAGKDRHSVDGPATGTGIFTSIAGSHAGFG